MTGLISSFGKDYFVASSVQTPQIKIKKGFEKYVYINGVCLDKLTPSGESPGTNTYIDSSLTLYQMSDGAYIYHIHINDCEKPFTLSIQTEGGGMVPVGEYYIINYTPQPDYNAEFVKTSKMLDTNTSYELLRANPKLTGNVKIVVDSDENLYMDTFKVSKGLSQRKYRKIKINPDEYYGRTLMSKMSSIPSTDFYKIENSCYDIFSLSNNLGEQYYDVYNSGTRTNSDKLYSENYSILAPLCIKKNMPDFFVIFKVSDYDSIATNTEKIKSFLSNGKIIKVFDLRKDSNAGKFMRNMYSNSKDYVGDLYIPYDYKQNNVYNGISIDRGEITEIYESAALCRQIKNQVAMNDWFTLGFERNRIVSKDIINFEFMFDDTSEELFTINTYFGIYIKLNGEEQDFNCLGFNSGNYPIFNAEIRGEDFNPSDPQFTDLIYGLTSPDGFTRLSSNVLSNDQSNVEILSKYAMMPYQNIASPVIIEMDPEIINKCYTFIRFDDVMDVGEHFRIIDDINKNIYEVILSNFKNDEFDISEINYYQENINSCIYDIQRITVYGIPYRNKISEFENITKEDEMRLLSDAFNAFGENIVQCCINGDNLCLIYNSSFINGSSSVYIEKVTSYHEIKYTESSESVLDYNDNSALIFGQDDMNPLLVRAVDDSGFKKLIYPTGFESLGDRIVYVYSFVPFITKEGYRLFHIGSNIDKETSKETNVIYKSNNGYTLIEPFSIYEMYENGTTKEIEVDSMPGFGSGTSLIQVSDTPINVQGKILIYNICPLNAGLFSIFQVKDINTDIIDRYGKISSNPADFISDTGGEFTSTKNVFDKALFNDSSRYSEESVMNYFDKYERFTEYTDTSKNIQPLSTAGEAELTKYLSTINSANHKYSDIAITSPYCCKWRAVGTDSRGEYMRIMFKYPENTGSYFISEDNDFYIGNVTVSDGKEYDDSSFDSCTYGYPKYMNAKFDPRTHSTFRNYLFYGKGSVDELLSNDGGGSAKMTTAYSNGKDTIEFISGGVKLSIQLKNSEFMNIEKYAGYSCIIVCSSGNNPAGLNPCEILFDEVNEQISVFIYNGSTPWQMFYNNNNAKKTVNGEVIIPKIYPVFHMTSISDCQTNYINDSSKVSLISDDSNMWRKNSSSKAVLTSPPYTQNGLCYMLSSVIDEESFNREKFSLLSGRVNSKSLDVYDFKDEYIATWDSCLFIDSERMEPFYSNFKKSSDGINDNVDFFIISNYVEDHENENNAETDYATLPLWKIKEIIKNSMIYVKRHNGTYNYSGLNEMFNIDIKKADIINVENSDFEIINSGTAYPSYCEPVTRDMFIFKNDIPLINDYFITDFEGCNLRIGDVSTIPQLWLRKVSDKPLTSAIDSNGYIIIETFKDTFEINDSSNYDFRLYNGMRLIVEENGSSSIHEIVEIDATTSTTTTIYAYSSDKDPYFNNDAGIVEIGSIIVINEKEFIVSDVDSYALHGEEDKYKYDKITFKIDDGLNIEPGFTVSVYYNGELYTLTTTKNTDVEYHIVGNFSTRPYDYTEHFITEDQNVTFFLEEDPSKYFIATFKNGQQVTIEESTTLTQIVSTTGFSVIHDMNPMVNCWKSNMYRIFSDLDNFIEMNGIESGYEKNTFFTSRGISLKHEESNGSITDFIELSKWENPVVDQVNHTITLNITDTLTKYIMYSDGYTKNWKNKIINDLSSKQRYVQNSILKYIDIDESCPIDIRSKTSNKLSLSNGLELISEYDKEGVEKKLYSENGKYYLLLENLKDYKYAVKMKIYI